MSFIEELAATASLHTLDALRHTTEDRATYVRSEFAELKSYVRRGLYRFLVARDKASGEPIGYLLLNLYHQDDLGRRQTFVEDIAAIPKYWGKGIGHALFDAATELTASLGIDFMAGEVAANNPRWEAAVRNNFHLEAYRLVRPCTPAAEALMARVEKARQDRAQVAEGLAGLKQRREAMKERRQKPS
ncbi:MAG: GNAT family N-acetyltransferase [Candidatus Eremiobacteraeota bacterium]|nr:GNAT family N-acetyltransferase [Candidatus Eremiobacteraeota bacterium]